MAQQQSPGELIKQVWQSIGRTIDLLRKALSLTWKANPRYTSLSLILHLAQGVLPTVHIYVMSLLIDRVAYIMQRPVSETYTMMYWLLPVLLIIAIKLLGMWTDFFTYYISNLLEHRSALYVQHLIFKKTAELDIAFFENSKSYDQLDVLRYGRWRLQRTAQQGMLVLNSTLSLILTLGLVLRYQPMAVLVLILCTIPYGVVFARQRSKNYQLETDLIPAQRMVNYIGFQLLGVRQTVKETRIFGLEPLLLQRYKEYSHQRIEKHKELMGKSVWWGSLISLLPTVGIGFVWIQAITRAVTNNITLGTMTLIVQTANQAQNTLKFQSQISGHLLAHAHYYDQLFAFLRMPPGEVAGALERPETTYPVPLTITQGITFEDVSFRYPGSEVDVLKHLRFTIHPGETVALVGENGAGKTTLVKLLARQFDPVSGTITLDGRNLVDYNLDSYLRQIGVIFQDFVRYHLPVRDNIGFGQVEELEDDLRVLRAADMGGARELIDGFPDGLDTMLGKTFDGGTDLSGGEWQKLALSRAFMRDGQLLILDEPIASLDALAEMEIYQRFADLVAGKIGVIVSHRFSTVKMADHILVLKDGELIEEGDHVSLMELGGHYAEMYTAQAQNYV